MDFRKAQMPDLEASFAVYTAAIRHMNENNIPQWDEIYPAEQHIRADIERGEHYLGCIGGEAAAAFTLNTDCDAEYAAGSWQWPDAKFYIVHRLCVSPLFQNRGLAGEVMRHIEGLVKDMGGETIRLDAFSLNPIALRLYAKLGYVRTGEVRFRKGLFYLFEKNIKTQEI
jgi:ribosomal protein S18 acetylase RimI-like enzyme